MPLFRFLTLVALVVTTALVLSGCDSDDDEDLSPAAVANLADIVIATPTYTSLEAALAAADLLAALEGEGDFTVFAPEDSAFIRLNETTGGAVNALLDEANVDALASVLSYHVVPQRVTAADLSDGQTLTTLEGQQLTVRRVGGDFFVEGAKIVGADVQANNGVLHRIDKVLTGAVDIVTLASISPNLSTLVTALGDADLVGTLQEAGPFTVFAPSNTAFTTFGALPEGDALRDALLYHVVPGLVYASDITDGLTATTAQGQPVTFSFVTDEETGAVTVLADDAPIAATDFAVSNGVIHVVGGVLTPE